MSTGFIPEPDNPAHWDFRKITLSQKLPETIDLRPFSSPRHDQGATGTCVAQAAVKALEVLRIKQGLSHFDLSRLAVYYLARELMTPPRTKVDSGTYVSLAFDVIRRFGVPPEADWPWDLSKMHTSPSWAAMRAARPYRVSSHFRIRSKGVTRVKDVQQALRAGYPVVFGTAVGKNWHDYKRGSAPLGVPQKKTGNHATVLLGWDGKHFIGENSWGMRWGEDGFYYMTTNVISSSQSSDFWVAVY